MYFHPVKSIDMNQNLLKNLTGLHQTQQSNKIGPDRGDIQRNEEEEERKAISLMYSLFPCKASPSLFPFQIKTTTKPIKHCNLTITVIHIKFLFISMLLTGWK